MTYPPTSGTPDPYQPVQAYGQNPDLSTPSLEQNPYAAHPYPAYGPQARTNALAIASLVCSLGGLIIYISAPVGVVLGHIARRQIRQTGEQGEGLAVAGLWTGYIVTILGIILAVGWLALVGFFLTTRTVTN